MTDLALAPEIQQLAKIVRSFSRDRLTATAEEAEGNRQISTAVLRSLDELGILSPLDSSVAQALDPVTMAVVAEELGAGDPGVAFEAMAGAHAALAVSQLGSREQIDAVVGTGSTTPAGSLWCLEGFGRGPDEFATTVKQSGDQLIVSGRKIAVVRPGTADFAVLIGRRGEQTVALLLDRDAINACAITRDDRESGKLGLTAAHTGDIEFADLPLPAHVLLEQQPYPAVDHLVASARLATAAVAVGVGTAAVEYAAKYATERTAFGQPIASYQGVTFPLAEADMQLSAARAAIIDLASRVRAITDPGVLARETGQVVAAASRAALAATVIGVNTLGGHGFLTDHPVERWYRAAGTLAAIDNDPLSFDC